MSTDTLSQSTEVSRRGLAAAGAFSLVGAIAMLVGATVQSTTGADLDASLSAGEIGDYLAAIAGAEATMFTNLSLWILGAFLLGVGGHLLSRHGEGTVSRLAGIGYLVGPALAIVAFVVWMALVRLAGTSPDLALADSLAFIASRVDWIATVLLVGFGPLLVAVGGRNSWVPGWLLALGGLSALAGVATVVAMYTGALHTVGFAIVPIGVIWTIAAGITAIRVGRRA